MPVPVDKLEYLLICLSKCDHEIEPNFHAVAEELKISNGNNAQKSFKKYVEESGRYKLVNRKIVLNPGCTGPSTPATPAVTPSKRASKKAANDDETPKKRKIAPKKKAASAKKASVEEAAGSEGEDNEDEA